MALTSCCNPQPRPTKQNVRRAASRFVGTGTLLLLLPKCPMCIAAYLTLFTGANVAISVAMHLRPIMVLAFLASALLLLLRCASLRTNSNNLTPRGQPPS
jgi:hypothetical protein